VRSSVPLPHPLAVAWSWCLNVADLVLLLAGPPLTAGSGCCSVAGGKAKPLKAPKAEKKDYDEVRSLLLPFRRWIGWPDERPVPASM
jgi:hypothetical protein